MIDKFKDTLAVGLPLIFALLLVAGIFWLAWTTAPDGPVKYDAHVYEVGQCVKIRISSESGMVVSQYHYSASYSVRVALASKTNSALFGAPNTENQRYARVRFYEFELEGCVQPEHAPTAHKDRD